MKKGLTKLPFKLSIVAGIIIGSCSTSVWAEEVDVQDEEEIETIKVRGQSTGTLIRGETPVGTNVVGFKSEDVSEIGVPDSNELLAQIPQMTSTFNSRPTMESDVGQGMPMPKLRDIGTGGGSTTLILLNGMRLPGSGLIQTVPNAAAIPPGVLGELEIVMDGGSSIYGSDAIAGVVNFITKSPQAQQGFTINLEGGLGDEYTAGSLNLTYGTSWDSGSAVVSLFHSENSEVLGKDRDFITGDSSAKGGGVYLSSNCTPGNIMLGDVSYKMDTRTQGSNQCDPTDNISYIPQEKKDTIFISMEQELSDNVYFDLLTYYSEWSINITGDATNTLTDLEASGTIDSTNPFFSAIGTEDSHDVVFNLSDVAGGGAQNGSEFNAFSFMPKITVDLPNDWRFTAAYSYGRAETQGVERGVNGDLLNQALAGTTTATALNPYNLSETNSSVLAGILDYYGTKAKATQSHNQVRLTVDGGLFDLPAGQAKAALGVEYFSQDYEVSFGGGPANALNMNHSKASRAVKSIFGEVVLPLVDSSSLGVVNFTASTRYDDYDDFGSTTNPKVGIDYSPTNNLRLRAQWGTSFQAPSMADSGAAVDTRLITLPVSPFADPASDTPDQDFFRGTLIIAGGSEGLQPEESESHSIGFDWTPDFSEGLSISMTYFDVDYSSAISLAPFWTPSVYYSTPGYEDFYVFDPSYEYVIEQVGHLRVDGMPVEALYADGATPYAIYDARRYNMSATKLSGIDFDFSKRWDTDFGNVNAGISGSYTLDRTFQPVQGAPYMDEKSTDERGDYNAVAHIGMKVDNLTTSVRVLHSDGWTNPVASADSITTVNLFASYSLGSSEYFEDAQITLNIDNLADAEATYFDDANGYFGGSVLGRVVYVGLNLKL